MPDKYDQGKIKERVNTSHENSEQTLAASETEEGADTHDIIVIGASAGGVETLQRLVKDLPADLAATLFVVVHTPPQAPGLLPGILQNAGNLPASYPQDKEIIQEGHIYVAPPNFHMLVEDNLIRVVRGPKENRHRPAIDPLFRSAARFYGSRVIGVVLTGMLDDGTFGLVAVKERGGLTVVQEPTDALYADMPTNALRQVPGIDFVIPVKEMGRLLTDLTHEVALPSTPSRVGTITEQIKIEDEFAMSDIPDFEILNRIGKPATIACPDCHGTLWEIDSGGVLRFRCRVGHAYSAQSLLEEHSEAVESAMWAALRNLEESTSINRRLAERARDGNDLERASNFIETALQSEQQAALLKRVLSTNRAIGGQIDS